MFKLNTLKRRKKARRQVALVLGSGAARGWAHIGVIEELKSVGINIDMVAGTSMGALVGAIYAAGRLPGLREIACRLDWRQMIYYFMELNFPRSGLIDGRKVVDFVRNYIQLERIEDLKIPFRAVATNIIDGNEYVFDRGDIVEAVRASIAIPGMFTPVHVERGILVDGGLVNPVPVSVARAMNADFVIAVDVNHYLTAPEIQTSHELTEIAEPADQLEVHEIARQIFDRVKTRLTEADNPFGRTARRWLKTSSTPGIFDVLGNSIRIMEARIAEARLQIDPPDMLIRPRLGHVNFMDFHRAEDIIAIGRQATRAALADGNPLK